MWCSACLQKPHPHIKSGYVSLKCLFLLNVGERQNNGFVQWDRSYCHCIFPSLYRITFQEVFCLQFRQGPVQLIPEIRLKHEETKRDKDKRKCESLTELLFVTARMWREACCKTIAEIKISDCAVICINHPQCHCHCRRRLQSFWESSPLSSPSSTVCCSGLHRSDCTAVVLPRPAGPEAPEAPPGQTPLEVAACLWALSSEYSFQHSWGHWRPRGGSPPACWGRWPGCRGFILNIRGWWK